MFTTTEPSLHFMTQVVTLTLFSDLRSRVSRQPLGEGRWRIEVAPPPAR